MPRFIALLATLLAQKSHRGPLSSSSPRLRGHCGRCKSSTFQYKIAKVRSCDLHLCSISLQMCPPSSKFDRSRSLMCPKSLSSAKNRRTSVLPKRNSCLSKATVVGFHSEGIQKSHFAAPLVLAKQYFSPNGSHLRAQKCPS